MMSDGFVSDVKVMSGITRDEGSFSTSVQATASTIDDVVNDVKDHFKSTCYVMTGDVDALRATEDAALMEIAMELVSNYQDLIHRYHQSDPEVRDKCTMLGSGKFPSIADNNYELAVKILGDHDFILSHLMAVWELSQHVPVYAYVFSDETTPGHTLAGHGSDLCYLWGT